VERELKSLVFEMGKPGFIFFGEFNACGLKGKGNVGSETTFGNS
jgi:hypothetical protein